jgi:hypothetical protein
MSNGDHARSVTPELSLGAKRMHQYRHRRRRGYRFVRLLLTTEDIRSLVEKGYLEQESQNDVYDALLGPVTRNGSST